MDDFAKTTQLIAENLTYYRKKAGLTQLQLAEKFNYSDKSVSKWERGESVPDTLVLKALADFYGISIDDFFRKEKVVINKQVRAKRRMFIVLLSVGLAWLVASLLFLALSIFVSEFRFSWLCFIYALVASFILLVVWSSIFHLRLGLFLSVSGLIWTSALSLFLSFHLMLHLPNTYLIFIVGIPLQVLAFLWYLLKKTIRIKKTLD
ncbi:MAG: helix-turn-helix domain-containing protein [Erysipelotrichaceae bacterium]|jgi:transcriptional regulator with XRE-family HTH domain|nr:helix-turn-helix domain-containing protein [Erysipelotrichaceae bacterium]HPY79952.1 helix-turn-helix domain-containing protein [Bacilli bacterium]HQA55978.1 helix-turn-helix domain-containing protein [Bacilli bacterium]